MIRASALVLLVLALWFVLAARRPAAISPTSAQTAPVGSVAPDAVLSISARPPGR